ncbi:NAD(P)-dependent alcohol dehydrogenase [Krasilnikovia sp. MM14-A1259]|uniref:NAD(P)-dependent alcohol dehydrogenase n=1 Tax=Krasilnikovia sp. MM14-A1259 TaxID=3373539 RepID=UPI0037FECA42
MKAILQDRYGAADVLRFAETDMPAPADGDVLVRVHAAAVNAYDWHVMRGDPYVARLMAGDVFGRRGPRVAVRGRDFAGTVEAVGAGVTRFRVGDEVFGMAPGTFAEYAVARADEIETKPANLTFTQAAALPLAGTTALEGLRDEGRIQPGQRVLVNGASGGVGAFAVQIAKAYGAYVTGVCSGGNAELVRGLGADAVVDYRRADFTAGPGHHDLVLDLVGNRSLGDLRRALTPTGTLVLSGGGVFRGGSVLGPITLIVRGRLTAPFIRQRVRVLTTAGGRANLAALRELAEAGKLTPAVDRTFGLPEAAEAIRYVETGHARGKVVVAL